MLLLKKYRLSDDSIYWHRLYFDLVPRWMTNNSPPFRWYNWAWYFYNPQKYVVHLWDEAKWFVQRGRRGYSDQDVWGWYSYIARTNAGALRTLAENKMGHPIGMTMEGWRGRLLKMADGFQAVIDDENDYTSYKRLSRKEYKGLLCRRKQRLLAGLKLYREHFQSLWD